MRISDWSSDVCSSDLIVPALIAGNAVVFKPSEKTPASGDFLVKCYHEAGVPEGCVRLVVGGPAEGKALAAHDGIDGLLFTGPARTGIALNRQFADRPGKILALELEVGRASWTERVVQYV